MNEVEKEAVASLRLKMGDLLTPKYDTDFNLLRWAIGYDMNVDEAAFQLEKHLQLRRFYEMDSILNRKTHPILDDYFPIGLIGETGIPSDNTLLVVECAGRIDLDGIMKTAQNTDFCLHRYAFQELVLGKLNEMECSTGRRASVIYILDLEGLKLDPSLISIVTGPYRILWASCYLNYPEWLKTVLIVNCPSFMGLLWKAISPLLPERTRNKVRICPDSKEAKEVARTLVSPSHLPTQWGGDMANNKVADRLSLKRDPISIDQYWKPDIHSPPVTSLTRVSIPPGRKLHVSFTLKSTSPAYFVINRYGDRTFGMTLQYSSSLDPSLDSSEMVDWLPFFEYPSMPTVDRLRERAPGSGVYRVIFHNESAWIRSLGICYRVLFEDENCLEIPFTTHDTLVS